MAFWIIFLRGINVGGRNKLPMAPLRNSLEQAGFADVKTYIQSGNIVLRENDSSSQSRVETTVKDMILGEFGLDISVMALSMEQLRMSMSLNPFGQSFETPNLMFLFFCQATPESPDLDTLVNLKTDRERLELIANVCYAYAGDGAGRSKMFARIEKSLGVPVTARNWRTLEKMVSIVEDIDGNT